MSEVEFVEFTTHPKGELVSITVFLEAEDMAKLKDTWFNKVKHCQAPLITDNKNGLHIHIPWILEGQDE